MLKFKSLLLFLLHLVIHLITHAGKTRIPTNAACASCRCMFAVRRNVGVRLLCFFLDRGWTASARMVLDTVLTHAAPIASFRGVAHAVAACNGERLGLLHRAVRSGHLCTITEVLGWGVQHKACLAWNTRGPQGLSPLHLLALSGSRPGLGADGAGTTPLAAVVLQTSPGVLVCCTPCGQQDNKLSMPWLVPKKLAS